MGLEGNKRSAPIDGEAEATRTATKRRRVADDDDRAGPSAKKARGIQSSDHQSSSTVTIDDLDPDGKDLVVSFIYFMVHMYACPCGGE